MSFALRTRRLLSLILVSILAACGQKGSLMSPSEVAEKRLEAEKLKAQATERETQAENKDNQQQ